MFVSAHVFSWLNKMFPSTTTIHLYYAQCRWHKVDINVVRRRQSVLDGVERCRKYESAFPPRSVFVLHFKVRSSPSFHHPLKTMECEYPIIHKCGQHRHVIRERDKALERLILARERGIFGTGT